MRTLIAAASAAILLTLGCGGRPGAESSQVTARAVPAAVAPEAAGAITVAPSAPTVAPGTDIMFIAASGNTWALVTNASGGTVESGWFDGQGRYRAGTTDHVTDVVTVTDYAGNVGVATIRVDSVAPPSTLAIEPAVGSAHFVTSGHSSYPGRVAFKAVGGSGAGYMWTILKPNPNCGDIDPLTGAFTTSYYPMTCTIQLADSESHLATAVVQVTGGGWPVSVSPAHAVVAASGSLDLSAAGGYVEGHSPVEPIFGFHFLSNASGATLSSLRATAHYVAGPVAGVTDSIQVSSPYSPSAIATIDVVEPVVVAPATLTLPAGGAAALAASGGTGLGYAWSLRTNASGGAIDGATGVYRAGQAGGVTDVVQVTDSARIAASLSITVSATTPITVSPSAPTVAPGTEVILYAGAGLDGDWSFVANGSGGTIAGSWMGPRYGRYRAGTTDHVTDVVTVIDGQGNAGVAVIQIDSGAPPSTLAITPNPGTVTWYPIGADQQARGQLQLSATGGSGAGFTWAIRTSPAAYCGSIDPTTGLYTTGRCEGDLVIQVTDSASNLATSVLHAVVKYPPLTVSPATLTVVTGSKAFFDLSGGGLDGRAPVWGCGLCTNESQGSVVKSAVFRCWYEAGPIAGATDVVCGSSPDGQTVRATVHVVSPVAISPAALALPAGGSRALAASGGTGAGYAWSLQANASGGSVDAATGLYRAGPSGGVTDVVQVTDSAGLTATLSITVETVWPPLLVTPSTAEVTVTFGSLSPGRTTFTAAGGTGLGLRWTVSQNATGSSIDPATGAYSAWREGVDVVQVTDSGGHTATATVTVRYVCPPFAPTVTPTTVPPRGRAVVQLVGGCLEPKVANGAAALRVNFSGGQVLRTGTGTFGYTAGPVGGVTDVLVISDDLRSSVERSILVTAGVTATPALREVSAGALAIFGAAGGSGEGFTWSIAANRSGATIDGATGLYTAGGRGGVEDELQVVDSLGNSATARARVLAPILVVPASASVRPGEAIAFTASGGNGGALTWALATNGSGGRIDPVTGRYVAGATAGVSDVIRVSDDWGERGEATVRVEAAPALGISPAAGSVPPRGTLALVALGGSGAGYRWSLAQNRSGGTIDPATGAYTAGALGWTVDVVRVVDSDGRSAEVPVRVTAPLIAWPPMVMARSGATVRLHAWGGSGTGLTWSLQQNRSGATIDRATGLYRAGRLAPARDVVAVTDSLGNRSSATVAVGRAPFRR